MKNMYPTPKMTIRNRNENAELPLLEVLFEPDDAAKTVEAAWLARMMSGMAGSGFENGRCYSRPPLPALTPLVPDHHSVGDAPCSSLLGAVSPRCAKARGVAIRPRGVRWRRPCWRR